MQSGQPGYTGVRLTAEWEGLAASEVCTRCSPNLQHQRLPGTRSKAQFLGLQTSSIRTLRSVPVTRILSSTPVPQFTRLNNCGHFQLNDLTTIQLQKEIPFKFYYLRQSLKYPGWPSTHYVADYLQLVILLPLSTSGVLRLQCEQRWWSMGYYFTALCKANILNKQICRICRYVSLNKQISVHF